MDNGKIITAAGLSSGIDGAFHLIAKIKGQGTAQEVALGMEYRWDPVSKFARAALADMRLPDFSGIEAELLSTEGDSDRWESRALVAKPNSAADILYSLGKQVVTGTPRTRGPVTLLPPSSTDSPQPEIEWKFTDEQGHPWRGSGRVEPAADHRGKFYLTLKLLRQTEDQKS
ncbi:MAG: hypothetical protein H0X40_06865 [Chthoniobacterales bacterium]|nr:hypothetical protein [Chthoniobacterales bacterium]